MKSRAIIISFLLLISLSSIANPIAGLPGFIPLKKGQNIASDLVHQGRLLSPIQAKKLWQNGLDLSDLNPSEDTDLWKDSFPLSLGGSSLGLSASDNFTYTSQLLSRSGNFRFTGQIETPEGIKTYIFMVSKQIHSVLLRKSLLEKIGYQVPAIQYLPEMTIKFDTPLGKELFTQRMSEATFGSPDRWVKEELEDGIVLQDLIAFEAITETYNLAQGFLPAAVINGRRLLNAAYVAFELVNLPESVNLLNWHAVREISQHIKLSYLSAENFTGSYEDAAWITKRILKLNRQDWEQVVDSANLPKPVAELLIEKLLSRRNQLADSLQISFTPIEYEEEITLLPDLKKGKLVTTQWPGYGSRFAYGDPESPLSQSELLALGQSKLLSNGIGNLMREFNSKIIPSTNIQEKVIEKQAEIARERFLEFLKTGRPSSTTVSAYVFPIVDLDVIASRDVVIGSYLGTDNKVQLADAVGVSVGAGAYIGVVGLPSPWHLAGRAMGNISRIYTHLRPIKSIKKALKYDFKNILVPLLKRNYGRLFDDLMTGNLTALKEEEKQKKLTEVLGEFKKNLEVGESILITDSVGASLNVQAGYKITDIIKAYGEFSSGQSIISRLHITRSSEDTIQIYKDLGNVTSLLVSVGLRAYIPVINITAQLNKGKARTKFYTLNISDNQTQNPDIFKNIEALRALFMHNSFELLDVLKDPFVVEHDFDEKIGKLGILFLKWASLRSQDHISVLHPEAEDPRHFYRRVHAKRKGKNFERLALDVFNEIIDEILGGGLYLSSTSTGRPGETILGESEVTSTILEGELFPTGDKKKPWKLDKTPYVYMSQSWRGWKIKRKKAEKILATINKKAEKPLFPGNILNNTKAILFYEISVEYHFYRAGLDHLLGLNPTEIKHIFNRYSRKNTVYRFDSGNQYAPGDTEYVWDRMSSLQYWYNEYYSKNKLKDYTRVLVSMIDLAEDYLTFEGMKVIFGGEQNLFVSAKVQGFKEESENGDQTFFSNSRGVIKGSGSSPLETLKNQLRMNNSEFYLYWLMGRL